MSKKSRSLEESKEGKKGCEEREFFLLPSPLPSPTLFLGPTPTWTSRAGINFVLYFSMSQNEIWQPQQYQLKQPAFDCKKNMSAHS